MLQILENRAEFPLGCSLTCKKQQAKVEKGMSKITLKIPAIDVRFMRKFPK
jgi:hypothetical protein